MFTGGTREKRGGDERGEQEELILVEANINEKETGGSNNDKWYFDKEFIEARLWFVQNHGGCVGRCPTCGRLGPDG